MEDIRLAISAPFQIRRIPNGLSATPCKVCGARPEMMVLVYQMHNLYAVCCTNKGNDSLSIAPCPMYVPPAGYFKAMDIFAVVHWNDHITQLKALVTPDGQKQNTH